MRDANKKGFYHKSDYDEATSKGFSKGHEWRDAKSKGTSSSDYKSYSSSHSAPRMRRTLSNRKAAAIAVGATAVYMGGRYALKKYIKHKKDQQAEKRKQNIELKKRNADQLQKLKDRQHPEELKDELKKAAHKRPQ